MHHFVHYLLVGLIMTALVEVGCTPTPHTFISTQRRIFPEYTLVRLHHFVSLLHLLYLQLFNLVVDSWQTHLIVGQVLVRISQVEILEPLVLASSVIVSEFVP